MATEATLVDLQESALDAIEQGEFFCYELAKQSHVEFEEVAHYGWFRRVVMRHLIDHMAKFAHLSNQELA